MLMLEAIGPRGEELAMEAGRATEIPVGETLASIEPEWQAHLRLVP